MNPQEPQQYQPPQPQQPVDDPKRRVDSELRVTQPGEVTIVDLKRHPIGIIIVYVAITLILAIMGYVVFGMAPDLETGSNTATVLGSLIFLVVATISLIYSIVATIVYWGNRWVLTSDSLTQINQTGLFHKHSSQLDLDDIEDVTSSHAGILSYIFKYGTINVETAGHHGKFVFTYAPNPNYYAQKILAAREALEHGQPTHHEPAPPAQPPAPGH